MRSFVGLGKTVPYTTENTKVCISAHNKIPLICNYNNGSLYIQKDNIKNNREYRANKVILGSEVTSQHDTGSINIIFGKTTIYATEVELYGETIVGTGAELEIIPQ